MNRADVVYADGISATLLARVAGARRIERAATTDIGWDLLRGFRESTGRPARIAAIGGQECLSTRALRVLEEYDLARDGMACHGYHRDWGAVLAEVAEHRPEVILVGLGMPLEMLWVQQHLAQLPPSLVLTCGGWFSFIVGDEPRAPQALRRMGLEWLFRWYHQPTRLAGRYFRGLLSFPVLASRAAADRLRSS